MVAGGVVIALLLALGGCEKCKTCSYSYTENGVEKIYRSQVCGNKDDRDSFENLVSEQADSMKVQYTCFIE